MDAIMQWVAELLQNPYALSAVVLVIARLFKIGDLNMVEKILSSAWPLIGMGWKLLCPNIPWPAISPDLDGDGDNTGADDVVPTPDPVAVNNTLPLDMTTIAGRVSACQAVGVEFSARGNVELHDQIKGAVGVMIDWPASQ